MPAAFVLALLLAAAPAVGAPVELFSDRGDLNAIQVYRLAPTEARARFVGFDTGPLFGAGGKALAAADLPELLLSPFPDVAFTGVVDSVEKDGFGTAWIGSLKEVDNGYFYLVAVDGAFIAHIATPEGVYEVSRTAEGAYRAIEMDQWYAGEDYPAPLDPAGKVLAAADLGPNADTSARIDILVAYTDDARAAEGSTAAMKARVKLAEVETNTAYSRSGVTTRLRLVNVVEYTYAETGNLSTDLTRFRSSGDGFFDSVHTLRNIYGADMVGLIVNNGGSYCGLASTIMANATNAFQVTARDCMTGYYTFGHEFGHLQGARHDVYVDSASTPYTYGHGYVHPGTTTATRWRTIMAYNDKCVDLGYSCTRLQYFSNPAKLYNGAALGNSLAKVYLVLNNTALTVANFRQQVIGSDFYSSFNGSSAGWWHYDASAGFWNHNTTSLYSAGLPSRFNFAFRQEKYGDVTYSARMYRTGGVTSLYSNFLLIRGNPAVRTASQLWKPSYLLGYTNDGRFGVYRISSAGTSTALKPWTAHTAIVKGGWNTLKVVAVGNMLKFYINNVLVWVGYDSTLRVGNVGLGYYRDAAAASMYVDWASAYNTPTAADVKDKVVPGIASIGSDPRGAP